MTKTIKLEYHQDEETHVVSPLDVPVGRIGLHPDNNLFEYFLKSILFFLFKTFNIQDSGKLLTFPGLI